MTDYLEEESSHCPSPATRQPLFTKWNLNNGGTSEKRQWRKPVSCGPCRVSKLKSLRTPSSRRVDNISTISTPRDTNRDSPRSVHDLVEQNDQLEGTLGLDSTQDLGTFFLNPLSPPETYSEGRSQQDETHLQWDALFQRPVSQTTFSPAILNGNSSSSHENLAFPFSFQPKIPRNEILALLPATSCCDHLVTEYFTRISPLFHIIHGPTFQKEYSSFLQNPLQASLSWMALLFAICSTTLKSMDHHEPTLKEFWPQISGPSDIQSIAYRLRTASMLCLTQDQFMIHHDISTLEALLVTIYTISNHEGAENAWTLLGLTLNIAIALKCHSDFDTPQINYIERERRRRCWAGVLLLHTYQATFFRDVDMSALLNFQATMPADVNDSDVTETKISNPSSQPTQMSLMRFKIQMFHLASKIFRHLSSESKYNESSLSIFDGQVVEEQRQWDAIFLLEGSPSLLDPSSYAHWCILQLYAHQIYLLLHRPFCRPSGDHFRAASRAKCIMSGTALLDIHQRFSELPRLRHYRWFVSGLTSFYAIHGALALASCLLDEPKTIDLTPYRSELDATVLRIANLQNTSQVCAKALPILRHVQALLSTDRPSILNMASYDFGITFNNWFDTMQWSNPESIDWTFPDDVLRNEQSEV
ncbi:hypothetical protein N7456_005634 [Penicillium angulare]|uniref:Xylanolytic transcriptional activator regulatory domain-containing protein n=1 Tax=Penicillium angulare TaxID=116970 RepID=A0A9W9KJI5_9EURO|nr:hypothetical protein N7456_005634 [Penicillium angulare]